jgi:predicted TIM-barrel fold metal-dependent hydrolase
VRTITLEEHCVTPELRAALGSQIHPYFPMHRWPPELEARLSDIGAGRVAEMDAAGIDVQVLSSCQPGLEQVEAARAVPVARAFNDAVAEAVRAHPGRFAGFAALPTADPGASAAELERAVHELGFVGALVNGRTLERFLDEQFFWPIFEAAEALEVPLYLHPMMPPRPVYDLYYDGFGEHVGAMLAAGAWGWHVELGLHCLRLMLAGVLDRFPRLQVIIGHMGEALPFMIERSTYFLWGGIAMERPAVKTELTSLEYLARNFHITTSGFFSNALLAFVLELIGPERVLFSVDHPFSDMAEGRRFLDAAPLPEEVRELIAHRNAERLLRLD